MFPSCPRRATEGLGEVNYALCILHYALTYDLPTRHSKTHKNML